MCLFNSVFQIIKLLRSCDFVRLPSSSRTRYSCHLIKFMILSSCLELQSRYPLLDCIRQRKSHSQKSRGCSCQLISVRTLAAWVVKVASFALTNSIADCDWFCCGLGSASFPIPRHLACTITQSICPLISVLRMGRLMGPSAPHHHG